MNQHIEHLKAELAGCVRFLHQQGWAPATSSNYSFRPPGGQRFWVSASGLDKGAFTAADFLEATPAGLAVAPGAKPSAETLLHALIYQQAPTAGCILHTHSIFNTVLSAALHARGQAALALSGFELLKALPGIATHETSISIPIFANSQDMAALAGQIGAHWAAQPDLRGFLLAGHGFYTWADDIARAKRCMEAFEFLFECAYRLQVLEN